MDLEDANEKLSTTIDEVHMNVRYANASAQMVVLPLIS